ncbi:heme-binding beta-barrel domain-containing protein [Aeromonas veronii]
MNKVILPIALITCATLAHAESSTIINGLDFGPLAQLAGTWKSTDAGGVDVAPGQEGSKVGKGGPAVEPFYEVITFEPAADAKNASEQYLVAMYYKQEVFRKSDNGKFHDQRGYLIYDKTISLFTIHTVYPVQSVWSLKAKRVTKSSSRRASAVLRKAII